MVMVSLPPLCLSLVWKKPWHRPGFFLTNVGLRAAMGTDRAPQGFSPGYDKGIAEGIGGLRHVTREASVKAEESSMRRAVVGGSRVVLVDGERRTCCNRGADSARNHSR